MEAPRVTELHLVFEVILDRYIYIYMQHKLFFPEVLGICVLLLAWSSHDLTEAGHDTACHV